MKKASLFKELQKNTKLFNKLSFFKNLINNAITHFPGAIFHNSRVYDIYERINKQYFHHFVHFFNLN